MNDIQNYADTYELPFLNGMKLIKKRILPKEAHKIDKIQINKEEFAGDKKGLTHIYCRKKRNNKIADQIMWADERNNSQYFTFYEHKDCWGRTVKFSRQFYETDENYIFILYRSNRPWKED